MEITISGTDRKRLKLTEKLAKELGLTIKKLHKQTETNEETQKKRAEERYRLMEVMSSSRAFQSIKDPVAWQREMREDKPLYARED